MKPMLSLPLLAPCMVLCAASFLQTSSSAGGYEQRSLVKKEGKSVGDFLVETLSDCAQKCDETPECNSFAFSVKAFRLKNKGCNLKSKVVTADEAESLNPKKGDYFSYYKLPPAEVVVNGEDEVSHEEPCELYPVHCPPSGSDILRLHAASVRLAPLAGVTPLHAVCVLAAGGVAVALLTLAVLSRASVRRFGLLPQPSSDAPPADEPQVAATVE